jgi:hypothetical protein
MPSTNGHNDWSKKVKKEGESSSFCCNPSLGLATKARGCKVTGQVRDPGAFHMLPEVQRVRE